MRLKKLIAKKRVINNHQTISNSLGLRNQRNPKRKRLKRLLEMPRVKWLKSL